MVLISFLYGAYVEHISRFQISTIYDLDCGLIRQSHLFIYEYRLWYSLLKKYLIFTDTNLKWQRVIRTKLHWQEYEWWFTRTFPFQLSIGYHTLLGSLLSAGLKCGDFYVMLWNVCHELINSPKTLVYGNFQLD